MSSKPHASGSQRSARRQGRRRNCRQFVADKRAFIIGHACHKMPPALYRYRCLQQQQQQQQRQRGRSVLSCRPVRLSISRPLAVFHRSANRQGRLQRLVNAVMPSSDSLWKHDVRDAAGLLCSSLFIHKTLMHAILSRTKQLTCFAHINVELSRPPTIALLVGHCLQTPRATPS